MAHYYCDESSDDDDLLDDGGYYDFKDKVKQNRVSRVFTEAEKLAQEKSTFYSALCSKNNELVMEYIDRGFDVEMNFGDGWTPLLLCVSTGNARLTEEFVIRGAKIDSIRDGMTTLMMACNCPKETADFSQSLEIIKLLVDFGVNPKSINRKRMTALMYAANSGNLPAVEYLLPLSDKNAEDNQKWTALFWAVNGDNVSVVEYLLKEGLKYDLCDVRNNTPLDVAKCNNNKKIISLFTSEEPHALISNDNFSYDSFEDSFNTSGEKPQFFLDICNFLCGVKAENAIRTFANNKISLSTFFSFSNSELKNLGVNLPYQRYRIMAGIHKFHEKPFSPTSLHIIKLEEMYSNTDLAVQLLTIVKHVIVMEACLLYMKKNQVEEEILEKEILSMEKQLTIFKRRVVLCKKVAKNIFSKSRQWDKALKPVDLITSNSGKFNLPWRKLILSVSLLSAFFIYKLRS
ncbi:ankyrin repeat, SAM and basic leucine zipper domain-containing protein 1 [Leptinotarsa decemlineata]|uniref:ankyrin repeat, SAM and basic leucine zipper domain-containing protein 1 n=1 Tax=Leptinotarsa decemlineata TaxID=7539 RepID=UPI003D30AF20